MQQEHCRYVPVLRWKRAERTALREVATRDRDSITPLIEALPVKFSGR